MGFLGGKKHRLDAFVEIYTQFVNAEVKWHNNTEMRGTDKPRDHKRKRSNSAQPSPDRKREEKPSAKRRRSNSLPGEYSIRIFLMKVCNP